MAMVPEALIDEQIAWLEANPEAFETSLTELQEEQPMLGAYLFAENHAVFTEAEQTLFLFLTLVIWRATRAAAPMVTADHLAEAEEANWELLPAGKKMDFRDKLDPFFQNYEQEDLLALVEDSLTADDEDAPLTPEGREALFISLKSVIDVLTS